jgi:hypothetical protein
MIRRKIQRCCCYYWSVPRTTLGRSTNILKIQSIWSNVRTDSRGLFDDKRYNYTLIFRRIGNRSSSQGCTCSNQNQEYYEQLTYNVRLVDSRPVTTCILCMILQDDCPMEENESGKSPIIQGTCAFGCNILYRGAGDNQLLIIEVALLLWAEEYCPSRRYRSSLESVCL